MIIARLFNRNSELIEAVVRRITGIPKDRSASMIHRTQDVFIDTKTETPVLSKLISDAEAEMYHENPEFKQAAFKEKWEFGTGAVCKLRDEIRRLATDANPITAEHIREFLLQVRATQDAFIKRCSGK